MILYYILVLSLPLTQHWLVGGGTGDITVIKYLALACTPFALVRIVGRTRPQGVKITGVGIAFVAYFLIGVTSYFIRGGRLTLEPTALMNIGSMLLFFFLTIGLVDTIDRLHRVVLVCIGSVGLASIYVIRDWLGNRQYAGYRPGGISGDANYFSLCASAALLMGLNLIFGKRSRREKLGILLCLIITSVALILAASRGGFLALGVGILYLMIRLSRGLRPVIALFLLLVPMLFLVPNTTVQRIIHPSQGEQQAVEFREITWRAGIKMFETYPLTGIGPGQFMDKVVSYEDPNGDTVQSLAHNTYIEVAAELGIFGFLSWIAILAFGIYTLTRFAKKDDPDIPPILREMSVGIQAALIMTAVGILFLSASWFRFLWLLMFLPSCFPMIAARSPVQVAERAEESNFQAVQMAH